MPACGLFRGTLVSAPAFNGQLASVSYTPFDGSAHPDSGRRSSAEQIRADLKAITPYTRMVRTYSSTGGAELVPEVAREFGLRVSVGAWIDKNTERNEREMRAVIDLARKHRNVDSVVVGNETIYRGEQTTDELISKIQRVKRETSVPVTTGEIWNAWIEHPELASAVDFIAAHVLPYWEGISETAAVDQAIRIYDKLRQAYPGKRIVIAEFGWPSAGYNRAIRQARAGSSRPPSSAISSRAPTRSASTTTSSRPSTSRGRRSKAASVPIGACSTPRARRNSPGPGRSPIPITGSSPAIAVLIGVLLSLPILAHCRRHRWRQHLLAAVAHTVGAWFAIVFAFWNGHYFVGARRSPLPSGPRAADPAGADRDGADRGDRRRRVRPQAAPTADRSPSAAGARRIRAESVDPRSGVSRAAGHAQADARCRRAARLSEFRMRCGHQQHARSGVVAADRGALPHARRALQVRREDNLAGFKAGALRLALAHTAADAEIIGVIDADYVVHPDWLKDLVPLFADPPRSA